MSRAFRDALRPTPKKHFGRNVCLSRRVSDSTGVNVETPSFRRLAEVYQTSAPALRGMMRRHDLTAQELCDPDLVFQKLLDAGRGCLLRSHLADPAARETIKQALQ